MTTMLNQTVIYLPDLEAQQFIVFQQRFAVFNLLEKGGVFNIQYGKAVLNFADGDLKTITKEEVIYKK